MFDTSDLGVFRAWTSASTRITATGSPFRACVTRQRGLVAEDTVVASMRLIAAGTEGSAR
ncbi:hypothetical protein [Streptomyces sp. YIM 98790]|uniref:hypothetical protein n=1 Tax=Streptomyces sp. YIM 98790 TaxID=2689077 RepID=UPI00140A0758|nr:hypothetical protein [Streptomyces sp. YIM 98790]